MAIDWGVLSVPTTFILDTKGRPRLMNHGVVREDKLLYQVRKVQKNKQKMYDE
jgi:hypothetical protein